jgi:single-strand DNA-binding protein
MSGSLNKVMIIGNLGKDPEIRTIPSGAKVANFSIATNEGYTDKSGNKVDKTEWHRIVMWRGLADVAEKYLRKGSTVFVEGKLTTRTWDDQNGQKRYTTEILANQMQMLGGKRDGGSDFGGGMPQEPAADNNQQSNFNSSPSEFSSMPPAQEDDLPF